MDEINVQKQISTGSETNSEECSKNDSKYTYIVVIILIVLKEFNERESNYILTIPWQALL